MRTARLPALPVATLQPGKGLAQRSATRFPQRVFSVSIWSPEDVDVVFDLLGNCTQTVIADAYEIDFGLWTQTQAAILRGEKVGSLDRRNLGEEIESLGKSERRELSSRLQIILLHLLKWTYQPKKRSASWQASIGENRIQIEALLADSPSLVREVEDRIAKAYPAARSKAIAETRLPPTKFPETNPFSNEQIFEMPIDEQSADKE